MLFKAPTHSATNRVLGYTSTERALLNGTFQKQKFLPGPTTSETMSGIQKDAAEVPMKALQAQRFLVRLRSSRSADDQLDVDGTVVELSLFGCRISSITPINTGMVFTLRIEVPGCEEPIQIEHAEVRWVKGIEFGLSFYSFTTNAYEFLTEVIQRLRLQTNEVAVSSPSSSSISQ
jgi:hypothetical protein